MVVDELERLNLRRVQGFGVKDDRAAGQVAGVVSTPGTATPGNRDPDHRDRRDPGYRHPEARQWSGKLPHGIGRLTLAGL